MFVQAGMRVTRSASHENPPKINLKTVTVIASGEKMSVSKHLNESGSIDPNEQRAYAMSEFQKYRPPMDAVLATFHAKYPHISVTYCTQSVASKQHKNAKYSYRDCDWPAPEPRTMEWTSAVKRKKATITSWIIDRKTIKKAERR